MDLDRLYRLAASHDITPLLYRGLRQLDPASALMPKLDEEIMQRALYFEIIVPQQLAELVGALTEAGIPCILLKGYALGLQVYEQPLMRPFVDHDLLIHPQDGYKAAQVLGEMGYRPDPDFDLSNHHHHLVPYLHPERLMVELHSELVTAKGALQVDMEQVWADSVTGDLQGVPIQMICLEHALIYLALHAVLTHLFEQGLKAICDVHELIQNHPVDWDKVIRDSHHWGCARQLYLMLRLVNEIYGDVVSGEVLHALSQQPITPQLLEYSLMNLRETTVTGMKDSSALADAWFQRDPRKRIRRIVSRLFPPREVINRYYHLDERGGSILFYYPRWQVMFLNRHFRTAWHLFRADPDTREKARYELIRRDLLAWVTKG